jgi:hypothetical protein
VIGCVVRREYGERTKTTRCSIRIVKNNVCYAICSVYPINILMLNSKIQDVA